MPESTLVDTVVGLADDDEALDDETKYLILAALEGDEALDDVVGGDGVRPATATAAFDEAEPVGVFLREISVAGFRGVGAAARLDLQPGPGITVVSGRNGSGKSSFAEAFELAVTGDSYRWRNKAKLWTRSSRNIHRGDPCQIRVALAVEGAPATSVGVDWAADADLADRTVWTQVAGQKRQPGVAQLGWGAATELYRPILSYDELGVLFEEGPSKLYDALAKLLGLDEIHDAENRLAARVKLWAPPARRRAKRCMRSRRDAPTPATSGRRKPRGCCGQGRPTSMPWSGSPPVPRTGRVGSWRCGSWPAPTLRTRRRSPPRPPRSGPSWPVRRTPPVRRCGSRTVSPF